MRTDELGTPIPLPRQHADLPPWETVLQADPCAYCGGPGGTVDHIVPRGKRASRERRSVALNGTGACADCNNLKAHLPLLRFLLGARREDRGTPAQGQCVSGKRVYYQERLANRAITKAMLRGELPALRHYECPHCGWWHLSRKRGSS